MKKILIVIIVTLVSFISCNKEERISDAKREINLSGTEWVQTDGDVSIGLKFYNKTDVAFFISDGPAINTAKGTYEYMSSIKKISFRNVYFYDKSTYKHILELRGGEIIDDKTMKISCWYNINGETGTMEEYLYKSK